MMRARDMHGSTAVVWIALVMAAQAGSGVAQSTASQATARNAAVQSAAQNLPQSEARSTELTVNGYDGRAAVIHRNGQAYVEVEGLARITGATLGFQGKSIVFTLPAPAIVAAAPAPAPVAEPAKPEDKGFTREFLRAGVEVMSVIREWRSALENAIRTGNPVDASWISNYRRNAEDRMAMASASATTASDRAALPLLQNAQGMIQQLSDRFLAQRSTYTYVPTTALDDDPLDAKILACAQGMAAVAVPGAEFQDVDACH